jgi:hypothetical protein
MPVGPLQLPDASPRPTSIRPKTATFLSINQKAKYVPNTDKTGKLLWTIVFEFCC